MRKFKLVTLLILVFVSISCWAQITKTPKNGGVPLTAYFRTGFWGSFTQGSSNRISDHGNPTADETAEMNKFKDLCIFKTEFQGQYTSSIIMEAKLSDYSGTNTTVPAYSKTVYNYDLSYVAVREGYAGATATYCFYAQKGNANTNELKYEWRSAGIGQFFDETNPSDALMQDGKTSYRNQIRKYSSQGTIRTCDNSSSAASKRFTLDDRWFLVACCSFGFWYRNSVAVIDNATDGYTYVKYSGKTTNYIYFDANGTGITVPNTQSKASDETITLRAPLSTAGRTFKYWTTAADGSGKRYKAGDTYSANAGMKLYAQCDCRLITYNANGGSGTMSSQLLWTGANLTDNNFIAPSGKRFKCWNTRADGKGTDYVNRYYIQTNSSNCEDLTLYAQWEDATALTIHFNANGGSGTMASKTVSKTGQHINVECTFTPPYGVNPWNKLAYWSTNPDGTGLRWDNDDDIWVGSSAGNYTGEFTLYAQWNYYVTFSFDPNGGTGEMYKNGGLKDQERFFEKCNFTSPNSHKEFYNWNTESNGAGRSFEDQGSYICNPDENLIGDIVLYAQWKDKDIELVANQNPDEQDVYYTTFWCDQNAYYIPEGVVAYIGIVNDEYIKLVEIEDGIIPCGEGVILKGNSPFITLKPASEDPDNYDVNIFTGSEENQTGTDMQYMLSYGYNGLGFYPATGKTLSPHKVYFTKSAGANSYRFVFGDDDATGLKSGETNENSNINAIHDVLGMPRTTLVRGINIVNGQKIMLK